MTRDPAAVGSDSGVTRPKGPGQHLIPPAGQEPEYFITAEFDEPSYDGDEPEVEVRLDYRKYVPPDYDVSDETVERAKQIPVPSEWTRYDLTEGTTTNGDSFTQFFGVPYDFSHEDLGAWFTGTDWTTGPDAFGALEVDDSPCRTTGPDAKEWMCTATVAGTRRDPARLGDQ